MQQALLHSSPMHRRHVFTHGHPTTDPLSACRTATRTARPAGWLMTSVDIRQSTHFCVPEMLIANPFVEEACPLIQLDCGDCPLDAGHGSVPEDMTRSLLPVMPDCAHDPEDLGSSLTGLTPGAGELFAPRLGPGKTTCVCALIGLLGRGRLRTWARRADVKTKEGPFSIAPVGNSACWSM